MGPQVRRREIQSFAVVHKMYWYTVLLKNKIVINHAMIASNICCDTKIYVKKTVVRTHC